LLDRNYLKTIKEIVLKALEIMMVTATAHANYLDDLLLKSKNNKYAFL
jgi:hypothetical protein